MSLINQMLKDLESRRHSELRAGGVLPGNSTHVGNKGSRPLNMILIGLVILLALGLTYTLWSQKNTTVNVTPPAEVTAVAAERSISQAASDTTPNKIKVIDRPQPAAAVIAPPPPERIKTTETTSPTVVVSDSRIFSITPSVVDGSSQLRTLIVRGEDLNANHSIVVSWADNEKVLPGDRVEWLDSSTAKIKLVTGNTDELWRVTLRRPDGSHSNTVEFEVIATAYSGSRNLETTANGRMEKVIRPPSKDEQANQLYQQGYHALQQHKADSAEQLWQQALTTAPGHIRSREGLIGLYLSQGRSIEVSKLLADGVSLHPDNIQFAMLYARLLTGQGNTAEAIATLEAAIGNAAQQPEFFSLLAALYQQQHDYSKSISAYQRALNMQPQQSNWWMGLGISLEGAGKQAEAKSSFEEALQRGMLGEKSQDYVKQRIQALK
jgi:Tfp pilus assembly protein PilF